MTREDIIRMAREAGWSGIYTQWREPDGSPDWTPVKESLTVPVTMEQIERFAALVAAAAKSEENEELRQGLVRMAALYEKAANDRDALFEKYVASAIRARGNK